MTLKTRLAAAALAAALSAPALAQEPCAVCGDPTWPAIATPAPATTLVSPEGAERPAILADPTAPEMAYAAPGARLVPHEAEGAIYSPPVPGVFEDATVHFAVVPDAPPTAVAAR